MELLAESDDKSGLIITFMLLHLPQNLGFNFNVHTILHFALILMLVTIIAWTTLPSQNLLASH